MKQRKKKWIKRIYSVERSLNDENLKDKFTDDEKKQLEDLVKEGKEAINANDNTKMFEKKDELEKVYSPIISRIYKENMPKDANGNPQVDPNMFSQMFGGTGTNPFAGKPGSGNPGFDPSMFKDATAK